MYLGGFISFALTQQKWSKKKDVKWPQMDSTEPRGLIRNMTINAISPRRMIVMLETGQ